MLKLSVFVLFIVMSWQASALTLKSGQSLSQSKQWQFLEMPESPIDNLTLPTKFPFEVNNRLSKKKQKEFEA